MQARLRRLPIPRDSIYLPLCPHPFGNAGTRHRDKGE